MKLSKTNNKRPGFNRLGFKRLGFTLVEVIIGGALTLLMFFAAIDVYVASARVATRTSAACASTTDAANAAQRVCLDVQTAHWLALPQETGWTSPQGEPPGAFQTLSGGVTVATGAVFAYPPPASATVQAVSGSPIALSTLADRPAVPQAAVMLWIYRADADGTPNAQTGQYLWERGTRAGQAVNQAILSSLPTTVSDAVQLGRPVDSTGQALPYQLRFRLLSVSGTAGQGRQTSEMNPDPALAAVVGKCVLLRDHELNLDHEPNPATPYGAINGTLHSD